MKIRNIVHILAVVLVLSAYSAWSRSAREQAAPIPASPPGQRFPLLQVPLLGLPEAEALWRREGTVFLDVRSTADYEFGHVAGALNLPEEDFDRRFAELKPRLERAQALVLYCKSEECAQGYWSAIRLYNRGLTRLRIFPGGYYEWINHNLPADRSPR